MGWQPGYHRERGKKMEERLTFEELKKRFPGKWVFVKNADADGPNIRSGEIICVCGDEEYGDKMVEMLRSGIDFKKFRTTHDFYGGFIYAENAATTIE